MAATLTGASDDDFISPLREQENRVSLLIPFISHLNLSKCEGIKKTKASEKWTGMMQLCIRSSLNAVLDR